jgi:hypothetical protein
MALIVMIPIQPDNTWTGLPGGTEYVELRNTSFHRQVLLKVGDKTVRLSVTDLQTALQALS